jgi:hypothetical protein
MGTEVIKLIFTLFLKMPREDVVFMGRGNSFQSEAPDYKKVLHCSMLNSVQLPNGSYSDYTTERATS